MVRSADDASAEAAGSAVATAVPEQQPASSGGDAPIAAQPEALPEVELEYVEPSGGQKAWTSTKVAFALPWRRFKSGSALVLKVSGQIAEQPQGRFSQTVSLPALCDCLKKAALDPRVAGVVVKIEPLACGWGKLQVCGWSDGATICSAGMGRARQGR